MNDGVHDCFRHNAWATREVIAACRELDADQLNAAVPGTFGGIMDTLRHLVGAEAGYYRRLTGEELDWFRADEARDLDELAQRHDDLVARWERFLTQPFDAERTSEVEWGEGFVRDVPAGVVLTQALHHANEHRTQICTTLTTIGAPAPALGVWEFAEATNRAPLRTV